MKEVKPSLKKLLWFLSADRRWSQFQDLHKNKIVMENTNNIAWFTIKEK